MSIKKEIERLQEQYKDVLQDKKINLEMEKSDPLDNRSARIYRVWVAFRGLDDFICEWGFCQNKEFIIERFENRLKERMESK